MEMKNSTRNRWIGYFGIAVATLLTPAGKLISSAVAAVATVAALVSMTGTKAEMEKSPVPAHATSSDHIDEYIANKIATVSDQSILEPDSGFLEQASDAAVTLSNMPPATIITTNSAPGPTGGGLSNAPSSGPMSGPGPLHRGPSLPGVSVTPPPSKLAPSSKLDCAQILKRGASEISDLEKAICDPIVTETTPDADTPIIVADSKPSNPAEPNAPTMLSNPTKISNPTELSNPAETTIPTKLSNPVKTPIPTELSNPTEPSNPIETTIPTELVNLPKIAELDDLPTTIIPASVPASEPAQTHRAISDDSRSAAVITAIPEPSTLGLMLLGMLSLVWIYRRSAAI